MQYNRVSIPALCALLVVGVLAFLFPITSYAILDVPFGGTIIAGPIPGIYCTGGVEVFYAKNPLLGISMYTVLPTAKRYKFYIPSAFKMVLGLFTPTPVPCVTTTIPPVPVGTAFPITLFGTSIR